MVMKDITKLKVKFVYQHATLGGERAYDLKYLIGECADALEGGFDILQNEASGTVKNNRLYLELPLGKSPLSTDYKRTHLMRDLRYVSERNVGLKISGAGVQWDRARNLIVAPVIADVDFEFFVALDFV